RVSAVVAFLLIILNPSTTFSPLFFLTATAPTEIYTLSLHDALPILPVFNERIAKAQELRNRYRSVHAAAAVPVQIPILLPALKVDRKSTRLNSSHVEISYAVFCLKKKKNRQRRELTRSRRRLRGIR